MGPWLALAGGLVTLLAGTPSFFNHPYSGFVGLRWAVGLTLLVGVAGMGIFLLRDDLIGFFVLAALCETLGWLGCGLILRRMSEQTKLNRRQRRRQQRKLPAFGLTAVFWVGALLTTVGLAISLVEGP